MIRPNLELFESRGEISTPEKEHTGLPRPWDQPFLFFLHLPQPLNCDASPSESCILSSSKTETDSVDDLLPALAVQGTRDKGAEYSPKICNARSWRKKSLTADPALSEADKSLCSPIMTNCARVCRTVKSRVVLAAIGTFVKGCFRGRDVPISTAFDAIQAKLEEAQATSAALRRGRSSASSSAAANSSSSSRTGHSRAGSSGGASAPARGATTASAAGADAAAGGGARAPTRVDYTSKVKERREGQGLKPPFAPGALASRTVWKNPGDHRQHEGAGYRLSYGADGTQAR